MNFDVTLIDNVILKHARVLLFPSWAILRFPNKLHKHFSIYSLPTKLFAAIIRTEIMIVPYSNDLYSLLLHLYVFRILLRFLYSLSSIILIQTGILNQASQFHLICIVCVAQPDPKIWPLFSDCLENV
jgi:hypothetical protein